MTMKPQKPLPRPQQAQVQVDLNKAEKRIKGVAKIALTLPMCLIPNSLIVY